MIEVIYFMALMKELSLISDIHIPKPEVFPKLFKVKKGCVSVAESKIFSPRTKHISIKYHYFQIIVHKKIIGICYIDNI